MTPVAIGNGLVSCSLLLHKRWPTREALIVAALLGLIFEFSYLAAFFVRGELLFRASDATTIVRTIWVVVALKLLVFYVRGLCHRPWRAARFADLGKLLGTATLALLVLVAFNYFAFYLPNWVNIPRSVLLLDWAFTILFVGGMQAVARSIYEELMPATTLGNQRAALVIDASEAGQNLAHELARSSGRYFIAGLLDDDPSHYGAHVGRARVLGPIAMAAACAERLRAKEIIVREGAIFGSQLRALCDACSEINVRVSVAESAVASGVLISSDAARRAKSVHVRNVELRDLLSRPQANLSDHDKNVFPFLNGKTVLITGAGGSIGSEICRQVVRFGPAKMILVERSEHALFSIQRDLAEREGAAAIEQVAMLCDITNVDRTERIFIDHRPEIVIHAAAFKHVPLMEAHPVEAIENNTLATASLAELADAHGVEAFVALSTDKAVHPSSIMGASKLVAERFLQAFGETSKTRFVAVRFGNVLGSSGSAVPIFEDQLARRVPITITHPSVRRYFMTIDEAAQLVLLAGALPGRGGTYVLEMGEPLKIIDLVHSVAFVMNIPQHEIAIQYCGLRPGEKLDEELFFEDERRDLTPNPLVIRVHRPARARDDVRSWLADLKHAAASDPDTAAHTLMDIVGSDCGAVSALSEAVVNNKPVSAG